MKLQFKHQKFQADAAKAVVDVFAGQPYLTPTYMMDRGDGDYHGENIIGLHQRAAFARQRKIPVVVAVVAVFAQELGSLHGAFEPFGTTLHLVIEHGEHPHFTTLQPDEFVGIVDAAVTIETRKIAAEFPIL